MTTVWPSRRLRFGRSRRTRRGSDDGMEKAPPTVRRWGRVPPPRAGFRVPWFPSGVPRAAEHGNGRHHAKGRRTDPPQGERCRPFPVPMPGVEPGAVLPKVVKGDFQGAGRSGAQGKGVADRIRPHWIRPATPFWFPWCAGRGSRGVPMPGVEPGAVLPKVVKGDFQGAGRSGAQGKGVADRIRPHWIRPATPFWFPWCAGRGSRGVPMPGVEPGAVLPKVVKGDFKESDGPAVGHGLGVAPRGGAGRRGGMDPVATWFRTAVSPCRRPAGPCGGGRRP